MSALVAVDGRPTADSTDPAENVTSCAVSVALPDGFHGARLIKPIPHKVIAFDTVYYPALEEFVWGGGKWTRGGVPPGELAFQRREDRKSVGNTGPSAAVASQICAFELLPAEGCRWYPNCDDHAAGFLVHDPGSFHRKMLRIAKTGHPPKTANDFPTSDEELFALGGFHIIQRGRGRNKTSDKRWQENEAWKVDRAKYERILEAGRGWSPLNPREDDRVLPSGAKYNLSNPVVKRILYEIDQHRLNFDSRKKLAAEVGINYETTRKTELEDINMKKEQPNTPFTAEQMKDFNAHGGRVVYVHVEGLDRPRWFKLDMDRHETYQEAIEEVRWKSQDEAFKKAKVPSRRTDKRTFHDHPTLARAFKEVVVRYALAFRPENLYILDLRTPLVVAIAEEAWEQNGVPNTILAP